MVNGDTSAADKGWNITVALGSIAFAYSYSYILLEMTVRKELLCGQRAALPQQPTHRARQRGCCWLWLREGGSGLERTACVLFCTHSRRMNNGAMVRARGRAHRTL